METGNRVRSNTFPEKGVGTVVSVQKVFSQLYAEVFFDAPREKVILSENDLVILSAPDVKLKSGTYSPSGQFLLRLLKDQLQAITTQEGIQSAGAFKILTLPHQVLAVSFVMDQFKPRALIADEVGLGKTIEAALIYEELKARDMVKNILIIAPSGLCEQWKDEMKLKFFEDFVIYDRTMIASLKKLYGEETNVWSVRDRIIASIDFVKPKAINGDLDPWTVRNREWHNAHVVEALLSAHFDLVIIDEAHKLTKDASGEETARYKIGKAVSEATPVLLLLTATPHQGDSAKFKNLLNLIDPYLFYKDSEVNPEDVKKIMVRNNKRAVVDLEGNRIFKQRITSLCVIERDAEQDKPEVELYEAVTDYVSQFYDYARQQNNRTLMFLLLIFQRMVSSSSRAILKSLSTRLEVLKEVKRGLKAQYQASSDNDVDFENLEEMAAEEQLQILDKYPALKSYQYLDIEIRELEKCISLAHKATVGRNDKKFLKLLEIIDEFKIREHDPNLKFIIFTEFVETQNYLNDCLSSLGYSTAIIRGSMSSEDRLKEKRRFQDEAQFLISTDAGGEGINLQFCWVMINYDLPWNPMRLEQRIGRIDRIGQNHDVKIVNFQLKDTVERRVRDVIEAKLETIKEEFNDGEDKLADIVSTLQDEFSFDKIYIDAVMKRKADLASLEAIAQQIYERAKRIISEGQLALPFTDINVGQSITKRDIERKSARIKDLVETYLATHGSKLTEYKGKRGVFYFENPLTHKRMHNVIFDQGYAVENEDFELLSLHHPFMIELIRFLDTTLEEHVTAKLQIREDKFAGEKGFVSLYKLSIANYIDRPREYIIPCFVNTDGKLNNRLSQYFTELDVSRVKDLIVGELPYDLSKIVRASDEAAEQKAETIFLEFKNQLTKKLREAENKLERYFADKENAVQRIAIENIRMAKLKELEKDKAEKLSEIQRRMHVVPSLKCQQVAYVEFYS